MAEQGTSYGTESDLDDKKSKTCPLGGEVSFTCTLCGFHMGRCRLVYKREDTMPKSVQFLEDVYVIDDPFPPKMNIPLVIGGVCCLCNIKVCVNQECSLFYSKRFCLPCLKKNIDKFPPEIEKELNKKKSGS